MSEPQILSKARDALYRFCRGVERKSIPAHPDDDDLRIANALDEFERLQAECAAMREVTDAVKNWRYGLIDKQTHGDVGSIACAYPAIYRLATTFDKLEHVIYPKDAHSERTCNNDGHKLTREQP